MFADYFTGRFSDNSLDNHVNEKSKKVTLMAALKHIGAKRLAAMVLSIVVAVGAVIAITLPLYNSAKEGVELRGEYADDAVPDVLQGVHDRPSCVVSGMRTHSRQYNDELF